MRIVRTIGFTLVLVSAAWADEPAAPSPAGPGAFGEPVPTPVPPPPGAKQPEVSAREVQEAVDDYLRNLEVPTDLLARRGFWIGSGQMKLGIGATLQARHETFRWSDADAEPQPGGDLSGFSLPRATVYFDGTAFCDTRFHMALEFGHPGSIADIPAALNDSFAEELEFGFTPPFAHGEIPLGILREAWIEQGFACSHAVRAGLIPTPSTRQLMTSPEEQQFVDISLASSVLGTFMPGYTDRNRDYGVGVHGDLFCDHVSYLLTVTNGDGPPSRNIWDLNSDDNLSYGGRVDWFPWGRIPFEEGARREYCEQVEAGVGVWGAGYHDINFDGPHTRFAARTAFGADAAARWRGLFATVAFNLVTFDGAASAFSPADLDVKTWLVQMGYLFPGGRFEAAVRYDAYRVDLGQGANIFGATELAAAATYHIDHHRNKLTVDAAWIMADKEGNLQADLYTGYNVTGESDAMLIRLQWQLAL